MANFSIAERLTGINEGGYSNDVHDHGGETYAGISRKFWPNWTGWQIIDRYKPLKNNQKLDSILLAEDVSNFYKANFWDVNKLDNINDQQIANNVYDFGVNSGISRGAKTLQKVVGVNQDGIIGNATLSAVNNGDAETIYNAYNKERINFYNQLAQNPDQAKFLHSWLSRIKPYVK